MTREQQEVADYTRAEFAQYPGDERRKMYEAFRIAAEAKWREDFGPSFLAKDASGSYLRECP